MPSHDACGRMFRASLASYSQLRPSSRVLLFAGDLLSPPGGPSCGLPADLMVQSPPQTLRPRHPIDLTWECILAALERMIGILPRLRFCVLLVDDSVSGIPQPALVPGQVHPVFDGRVDRHPEHHRPRLCRAPAISPKRVSRFCLMRHARHGPLEPLPSLNGPWAAYRVIPVDLHSVRSRRACLVARAIRI